MLAKIGKFLDGLGYVLAALIVLWGGIGLIYSESLIGAVLMAFLTALAAWSVWLTLRGAKYLFGLY